MDPVTLGMARAAIRKAAINPDDVGKDGILVIGQSNTGSGDGADTLLDYADSRIEQFANLGNATYYRKPIPATEPLAHYTSMGSARAGFALTFAKMYVGTVPLNRRVSLIPCGKGSTSMDGAEGFTWDPNNTTAGTNLALAAIAQGQAFLASGTNNRIVAILFHQGEGDSGTTAVANLYAGRFDGLIDAMRAAFGADVPFVLGQMTPDRMAEHVGFFGANSGYPIVNAVHIDTPRRKLRTGFWYGVAGMVNGESEKIHYNAAGQRINGVACFEAYRRALRNVTGVAPVVPSNVRVVQTGTSTARVLWDQVYGRVENYSIEQRINNGAWTAVTRPQSIDVTADLTGLPVGATVQARVRTINAVGTSAATTSAAATLVTPPAQVTGLSAGTPTQSAVPLSWTAVSGAASYVAKYRKQGVTPYTTFGTASGTALSITGLDPSSTYEFTVEAANGVATGPASAAVTATTAAFTGMVDDIAATAFAAHSLRKVRAGYTGPAIKVRRTSDNTEQDISFLPNGTLDTAALLTFVGAGGGAVSALYDQSGNGRHFVQATAANQPIIAELGSVVTKNGRPTLRFTGSSWLMGLFAGLYAAGASTTLGVYTAPASADSTMPLLCEASNTTSNQSRYFTAWWSGGGAPVIQITDAAGATVKQSVGAAVAKNSALRQLSMFDSGTSHSAWVDGVANLAPVAYTRSGSTLFERQFLGGQAIPGSNTPNPTFTGLVSEIVTFGAGLNATQRQAGEASEKAYFATA